MPGQCDLDPRANHHNRYRTRISRLFPQRPPALAHAPVKRASNERLALHRTSPVGRSRIPLDPDWPSS
jgi:hypothetical protein